MRVVFLGLLLGVIGALAERERCGPNKQCPSDKPCCSVDGYCGGGAAQCTSGCQPQFSLSPVSCIPNPVCRNMDLDVKSNMYNQDRYFMPLLRYNGDATQTNFVFEEGYLGKGQDGVLFEKNAAMDSRVSTANYVLYGNITAKLRHNPTSGFVTTFGTLSDVGDMISFSFGGPNKARITTNYGANGSKAQPIGTQKRMNNFNIGDFHDYTIEWAPDKITWKVDNNIIRNVLRKDAQGKFPRSPSRVLFTASGVQENDAKSKKNWANGTLSFSKASFQQRGYYSHELSHLRINCASSKVANVNTTGVGERPVAYVYDNSTNPSTHELNFMLSMDSMRLLTSPAKDGRPGMPGSPGQSPNGDKPNMYTGGSNGSSKSSGNADDDTVSNGIKIGIPVGIGGAVLLGALALLIFYFVRRQKRAARRPPSSLISEPASIPPSDRMGHAAPSSLMNEHQQLDMAPVSVQQPQALLGPQPSYDLNQSISVPQTEHAIEDFSPDTSQESKEELMHTGDNPEATRDLDEAAYYYQDLYSRDDDAVYDVDSDTNSQVSDDKPRHMHYAGHGDMRRYYPRLTEEENERLAAQDAWDELREAAIGETDDSFFKSHYRTTSADPRRDSDLFISRRRNPGPHRPRRAHHRAAYSDGGALSPAISDEASFSPYASPHMDEWH